ncbi:hypothetical protein [Geodermatophilus sp. CPCC 205761]|uniref:hypothetical protein n=1 Tax=Geodermatophilus sp. CPCC 205761 TaxID=2936597 RepID=UPI003EEF4AB8
MDAARVRAELTVQDLWLQYVALGGSSDAFDLDAYLQGLAPLEAFQQDILAQALNERLEDLYQAARIPLSDPMPGTGDAIPLQDAVDHLLRRQPPAAEAPEASGGEPA